MLTSKWIRIALLFCSACALIFKSGLVYPQAHKNSGFVNEASAAKVEIYTTTYCGECIKAKSYMKANKIVYKEYNVEENRDLLRRFYEIGGKGVPLIFVRGKKLEGFDAQEFEALRQAKSAS